MKIVKLELYKYKRLSLNQIEKLTYIPKHPIQFIIGKNASGKSSILRQLNPLPADIKKDFNEDGYKYIELEHNGNRYVLTSNVIPNKYSFKVNDQELNPSGNKRTYLELVLQHFKITEEVMSVLYNDIRFTYMAPNDRKKWLSKLSTVDYTYSLLVYSKLRTRHRDLIGGIKLLQNNIIELESKLLKGDILAKYKQDKIYISKFIDHIISLHKHSVKDMELDSKELYNLSRSIDNLYTIIDNSYSKEDYIKTKLEYSNKIEYNKTRLEQLYKELDNLEKTLDIEEEQELKRLDKLITELKDHLFIDLDITNLDKIRDSYSNMLPTLIQMLLNLELYDNVRSITQEDQAIFFKSKEELEIELRSINTRLTVLMEELNDLTNKSQDITCPLCNGTFNLMLDKLNKLKQDRLKLLDIKDKLENKLETYTKKYDRIVSKNNQINEIRSYLLEHGDLKPIWKYVFTTYNINTDSISNIVGLLDKITIMFNNTQDLSKHYKAYTDLKLKASITKEIVDKNNKDRKNLLHKEIEDLSKENIRLSKEISNLTNNISNIVNLEDKYKILKSKLLSTKNYISNDIDKLRNKYLGMLVTDLKEELINIDNSILENDMLLSKIKTNRDKIEDYKTREKVLSIVLKKLSPNEGLIARSINSFITLIIQEMNMVISNIWSYDLEILPCDILEDELDYKFKVKVNREDIMDDISKTSSGMREIIDLAFRIVFSKYYFHLDIPLYLDEFGATFDKVHRNSAYNTIDKILSSEYDQIFIICHYESLYGSFQNADFNVLENDTYDVSNSGAMIFNKE